MKSGKMTCLGILAIGFFLVTACSNEEMTNESCEVVALENLTKMPAKGVLLSTAESDIQHYVDSCYRYFTSINLPPTTCDSIVRSYTVTSHDMLGVLGVKRTGECAFPFDSCRVYLGLDTKNKFKLYMTPVNKDGNDTILSFMDGGKATQFVYDLNAPCPSTCDYSSPLYKNYKRSSKK